MFLNKMTLANLVVLIAIGLVCVVTPAMAARFDGIADPTTGGTLPDKTWVQGQANVSITLPKIVATADPAGALTATLNVAGSGDLASDGDEAGRTVGGTNPLTGLIFSFDPATGEGKLSGRASATQADIQSVSIVYTAIEATVADNVPITLTVFVTINEAPDLTFGSETVANLSLNTTDLVNVVFPAATGGIEPLTYVITTADGSAFNITGLTFNATTRRLFGIPAAGSARAVYLYTVTDGGDSAAAADSPNVQESESLRFTIEVDATPPDFSPKFPTALTKVPDRNYTKDHDVSNPAASVALPEAEAGTGTGALTYSLAPLPAGLSFDPATRMLSGTPTAAGVTDATYTVTDAADLTDTLDFKITVNAAVSAMAPPNFPATGTSYLLGNPFADITVPAATGGTGAKSVMVTGLPDGLMQDGMKITGTPTATGSSTVTITATDTVGAMGSADFTITVTAAPNLSFSHVIVPQSYEVGKPIPPMLLPRGVGGIPPHTYTLEPLPEGLSFSPTTRLLSGTPRTAQPATAHIYTISDSAFSHIASPGANQMPNTIELPITITVTEPAAPANRPPDFGTATVDSIVATVGTAIPGRFLPEADDPDGDTLTYSIVQDLPSGLRFDPSTRALTGTPTIAMPETPYTYQAADPSGATDTIGFFITVTAGTPAPANRPPTFAATATVANIVATVGQSIPERTLPAATDPDGDTVRYWISPALPTGLIFNPTTRALTGTPTTEMAQTAYTYNAADAGSLTTPAQLPFFITVNATTPIDVNGDGQVTVIDLAMVALFYGTRVPAGISIPADVNADGVVNILDLTAVAQGVDATSGGPNQLSLEEVKAAVAAAAEQAEALEEVAAAPMHFSIRPEGRSRGTVAYLNVADALAEARHPAVSDVLSKFLELLAETKVIPETSALLPNYPNPFNPETWIPYHLAKAANVTLTIYDVRGSVVRELVLGHQPTGVYVSRGRAAYWDGKNQIGESVASGVYFYTLTAGDFTATRKLLIAK